MASKEREREGERDAGVRCARDWHEFVAHGPALGQAASPSPTESQSRTGLTSFLALLMGVGKSSSSKD